MTDNATLAKRIVELDRELSLTKDLLQSSMLSEATAKQYAEEVDKQNKELAAQVESVVNAFTDATNTPEMQAVGKILKEAFGRG